MEIIKSNDKLYSFNTEVAFGRYGILIPEEAKEKIEKLSIEYTNEVKKILYEHKDKMYEYGWTLANKMENGEIKKQRVIVYTTKSKGDLEYGLFMYEAPKPKYEPEVFIVRDYEEATQVAKLILEKELAQENISNKGEQK